MRNKKFQKLSAQREKQLLDGVPTVLDDREFLRARGDYESHRKELHSDYIREKARCAKNDPKSFWRHVNSKRKSNNLPAVMEFNGEKASTNAEKTNMFAEYFQSVYVEHPLDPMLMEFIRKRDDSCFYDVTSTEELVLSVFGLDRSKQ